MRIPALEAAPIPLKKLKGTEITKAQGQDTTKNAKALNIQSLKLYSPLMIGGKIASNTAKLITIGVYIFANLVINLSDVDFLAAAFSTKSKTLLTVESKYSFVTFANISAFRFIQPLNIVAPSLTSTGIDSPVRAEVSRVVSPFIIMASSGTLSPGLISIISSICTSSGSTFIDLLSLITLAYSGLISIISAIDFLDLLIA